MSRANYNDGQKYDEPATGQQEADASKSGNKIFTCYWILFWIIIPFLVSNVMQSDFFGESFRGINIAGQILTVACILLYGIILMILGDLHPCYSKAGTFLIVISVLYAAAEIFMNKTDSDIYSLIRAFLVFVSYMFFLRSSYLEFQAHATVMSDIDKKLSRKWWNFRIWFAILFIIVPCGAIVLIAVWAVVLSIISFIIIGTLLCLASILAVYILKIRYLYLTAYAYTYREQR